MSGFYFPWPMKVLIVVLWIPVHLFYVWPKKLIQKWKVRK